MPTIVVVGRGVADGVVEVRDRATGDKQEVSLAEVAGEVVTVVRTGTCGSWSDGLDASAESGLAGERDGRRGDARATCFHIASRTAASDSPVSANPRSSASSVDPMTTRQAAAASVSMSWASCSADAASVDGDRDLVRRSRFRCGGAALRSAGRWSRRAGAGARTGPR